MPATPPGNPSGSVLDFGRYAGWSLGQIATADAVYPGVAGAHADRAELQPRDRCAPGDEHGYQGSCYCCRKGRPAAQARPSRLTTERIVARQSHPRDAVGSLGEG